MRSVVDTRNEVKTTAKAVRKMVKLDNPYANVMDDMDFEEVSISTNMDDTSDNKGKAKDKPNADVEHANKEVGERKGGKKVSVLKSDTSVTTKGFTIYLSEIDQRCLKIEAFSRGITISELVRQILSESLKKYRDKYVDFLK